MVNFDENSNETMNCSSHARIKNLQSLLMVDNIEVEQVIISNEEDDRLLGIDGDKMVCLNKMCPLNENYDKEEESFKTKTIEWRCVIKDSNGMALNDDKRIEEVINSSPMERCP